MFRNALGLSSAILILVSCTPSDPPEPSSAQNPVATPTQANAIESKAQITSGPKGPKAADGLTSSFDELVSSMQGKVGLAVAGDGEVKSFGSWIDGPAWSTIKVPLAIAGLRQSEAATKSFVPLAIKDSDNDAAEAIWAQLGSPQQAGSAVEAILREGGDPTTVVQTERLRPKYTPFGQTIWPLAQQATFASFLPCLDRSQSVLGDMHHLSGNQLWALALRSDTAAKGGWGPSETGAYLVRQLAVVETSSGNIGVALSAEPNDGTLETGIALLNRLAEWIGNNLDSFKGRTC